MTENRGVKRGELILPQFPLDMWVAWMTLTVMESLNRKGKNGRREGTFLKSTMLLSLDSWLCHCLLTYLPACLLKYLLTFKLNKVATQTQLIFQQ